MSTKRKTAIGPETSGYGDPRTDYFADVKRALHEHAMKNYPEARARSEMTLARNLARHSNRYSELEPDDEPA